MKMKFICLLASLYFIVNPISYAALLDNQMSAKDIMQKLPSLNNIECKFKQEKKLKNIQKPLISGGNFKFDKTKGIFFETTYPIKSTTAYTNKDYEEINSIILSIANKKYTRLDNTFNLYYTINNNIWELGLTPKEKTIPNKYINKIIITGTNYINKITIDLKDGSIITQWFSID